MTREEAIKFLKLMRKAVSNFEEYGHDKASMVIECDKAEAIDMAISALSAERVGEWIYRGTFKFSNHYPKHRYECSECHQIVHLPLTEEAYRYCPNCGARMESKK